MDNIKSRRLHVPEDVLISEVGEESVLLDLKSEKYFGLDAVGTDMWSALSTSGSVQEALDMLLDIYEVDAERLEQDLLALVEKLAASGLIEIGGDKQKTDVP